MRCSRGRKAIITAHGGAVRYSGTVAALPLTMTASRESSRWGDRSCSREERWQRTRNSEVGSRLTWQGG